MSIPKGKLVYVGASGDGKRMFINHKPDEGSRSDFGVEIDTDDVDPIHIADMANELIRRWNSFEK